MKTALIIFFVLVIALGIFSGIKSKGRMCDDPQVCAGWTDAENEVEVGF